MTEVSREEALTALVHAARGLGLGSAEIVRLGAHFAAALRIDTEVHERVWRAAGLYPSFTCPRCRRTSWNPEDIRHGYCGACHDYTGGEDPRTMTETDDAPKRILQLVDEDRVSTQARIVVSYDGVSWTAELQRPGRTPWTASYDQKTGRGLRSPGEALLQLEIVARRNAAEIERRGV